MKYSEFKAMNEQNRGLKSTVEYTLFEMNLVRLRTELLDNVVGGVDQTEYLTANEVIRRVAFGECHIDNPERLHAYNWQPEDIRQIGYSMPERCYA